MTSSYLGGLLTLAHRFHTVLLYFDGPGALVYLMPPPANWRPDKDRICQIEQTKLMKIVQKIVKKGENFQMRPRIST